MLIEWMDNFVFDVIETKLSVLVSFADEHHKTGLNNCDISHCVL